MAETKIFFIELNVENKFRHACDIIENLYEKNISVTVFVNEEKFASLLDKQLWTWKQESFIPHINLNHVAAQPDL
ncbi:MAG: DNA polymerase III subunit chi [Calditrichaceae bacterium]